MILLKLFGWHTQNTTSAYTCLCYKMSTFSCIVEKFAIIIDCLYDKNKTNTHIYKNKKSYDDWYDIEPSTIW